MTQLVKVKLNKVSKRYTDQWIIKNLDFLMEPNQVYGVKGINGSGKSTLLKMICGYLSPSAGEVIYESKNRLLSRDDIYKHVTIWAPYVSLIKELSISEMVNHFLIHKPLWKDISIEEFYQIMNLPVRKTSKVGDLSSGQEQRLGLALAIMTSSDLLILDEPSSYLDENSKSWLYDLLSQHQENRIVVIASNDSNDLGSCDESIDIADFK